MQQNLIFGTPIIIMVMTNPFLTTQYLFKHDKIFSRDKTFCHDKNFSRDNISSISRLFRFVNHACCKYVCMADNNNNEMNEDENDVIKSYFFQSFCIQDILRFLSHGISISKSALQRRLKSYNVSRKCAE